MIVIGCLYLMLVVGLGVGVMLARAWPSKIERLVSELDRGLTRFQISYELLGWSVRVIGPWTDWKEEEFYGRTMIEAVENAVRRMNERN